MRLPSSISSAFASSVAFTTELDAMSGAGFSGANGEFTVENGEFTSKICDFTNQTDGFDHEKLENFVSIMVNHQNLGFNHVLRVLLKLEDSYLSWNLVDQFDGGKPWFESTPSLGITQIYENESRVSWNLVVK